jgi:alkanesulfonate monooxygenase SsuD/methylene tetrahydromethanopterin reductase-like flavin-dependent oxidoreductase (luciferase family)
MSTMIEVGTTPWSWELPGSAQSLCRQAEAAESLGFHSFWLPENHFGSRSALPSPLILLAAVAARTERIRLGTTSYLLPIRPPLLAAEDVAVLDQLSGGRLILGVGRGISGAMFRAFEVDPADKRKLFQINLDIMRRAWCGEPVAEDENGAPIVLSPLPLQQPSPPIWVAAFGPLALRQVAGLGLPYLASPIESLTVLEENYQRYHKAVALAGLPAVQTIPVMRSMFVTDDAALATRVRAALEVAVPAGLRSEDIALDEWAIVGDRQYARDKISEYIERLGVSHLIVRAGISGVAEEEQIHSHQMLLEIISGL